MCLQVFRVFSIALVILLGSFNHQKHFQKHSISARDLNFRVMVLDKKFIQAYNIGQTGSLVFQHSNPSKHSKRRNYSLEYVFAYNSNGTLISPTAGYQLEEATNNTKSVQTPKHLAIGNLRLPAADLDALVNSFPGYNYLRFEPVNNSSGDLGKYISYLVYPVIDKSQVFTFTKEALEQQRLLQEQQRKSQMQPPAPQEQKQQGGSNIQTVQFRYLNPSPPY